MSRSSSRSKIITYCILQPAAADMYVHMSTIESESAYYPMFMHKLLLHPFAFSRRASLWRASRVGFYLRVCTFTVPVKVAVVNL